MSGKPYLVFGMPRAGTVPAYRALAYYMSQTRGMTGLGDFLDFSFNAVTSEASGAVISPGPERKPIDLAISERFLVLQKTFGKHCLKIFPVMPIPNGFRRYSEDQLYFLMHGFEWVLVERRNVFEAALSVAVSFATGIYYQKGGIQVPGRSLDLNPHCFEWFGEYLREYHSIKQRLQTPLRVLVYEDFIRLKGPAEWLASVGLTEAVDFSKMNVPEKQNKGDKLSLFKDPERVLASYRASFMQSLHPV